jgi:23S rRNA (adenine2030-N6)-methyltransferase
MPGDYDHHRHAGNHGDVWKHCALVAWLQALGAADPRPLDYLETHAGAGRYRLARAGEWRDGIARVVEAPAGDAPEAVRLYLERFLRVGIWTDQGRVYPGSPNLAQHSLGPGDRLLLHELEPGAAGILREKLGGDPRVAVLERDGPSGLVELLEGRASGLRAGARAAAVVDPPYSQKAEWLATGRACLAALRARPELALFLWYPIVSRTRPQALLAQLAAGGARGEALELVVTPLGLGRQQLNGSGVALVNAPAAAVADITAAGPWLGRALSTRGAWELRAQSFGPPKALAASGVASPGTR